jgi:Spy/CpxP family protein refolding chaperone
MHYKSTLIIFILLAFLALPLMVLAQPEKDIKIITKRGTAIERIELNKDGDNFDMPIFGMLKLTDDQEKDFMKLRFDIEKKQTEAQAKVRTAQIELKELFTADNPDHAAIEKKVKEISDLKTKLHLNRLDHWFAVNKILKPEQQKIWKKHLGKGRGVGMNEGRRPFGPKFKMRIDKEIRRGNPDCPNMDPENN